MTSPSTRGLADFALGMTERNPDALRSTRRWRGRTDSALRRSVIVLAAGAAMQLELLVVAPRQRQRVAGERALQVDLLPGLDPLDLQALAVEHVGAVPMIVRLVGARPAVHFEAVAARIELELEPFATARDMLVPATGQRMAFPAAAGPSQRSEQGRGDAQLHRRDITQLVAAAHAQCTACTHARRIWPVPARRGLASARPSHGECAHGN